MIFLTSLLITANIEINIYLLILTMAPDLLSNINTFSYFLMRRYIFSSFGQFGNQTRDKDRRMKSGLKNNQRKRNFNKFSRDTINSNNFFVFQITHHVKNLSHISCISKQNVIIVTNIFNTFFELLCGCTFNKSCKVKFFS